MPEERLQKILARAGVASRRKAEALMLEGRVAVNGRTVTELGTKADLERDHIKVDGKLLRPPKRLVYLAFHKPKGVVTTLSDPQGRPTVLEFLKGVKERVFPVGRLDYASEGLLLLTNDGEFSNRITSAASHVAKTYVVKVTGQLTPEQEEQFRAGIPLHGRRTAPAGLRLARRAENPWYEVRLSQGRHHQIREMFKHFGRLVEKIKRVKIGFLELGSLEAGRHRPLTPAEVERFRRILKLGEPEDAQHS
jgi:23S rRNA pseudouridine2605 synthase